MDDLNKLEISLRRMKRDVRVVKDPDKLRVSLEKNRSQILGLLRVKDMTISQISEALNKDQSTVYRHIKKLEEADLVEVCGERRQHHIPERVYGRTANVFVPRIEPMETGSISSIWITWKKEQIEEIVDNLEDIGYDFRDKDDIVKSLNDFLICANKHLTEKLGSTDKDHTNLHFFHTLRLKMILLLIELIKNKELNEDLSDIISKIEEIRE